MRKILFLIIFLMISFVFCSCVTNVTNDTSCSSYDKNSNNNASNSNFSSALLESTDNIHSPLYIEKYTYSQIFEYFEEIALNMEYHDGQGNVQLVQKWTAPIYYTIYGSYNDEDVNILKMNIIVISVF